MPTAQNILDRKGQDVATIAKSANVLEAATLMNQKRIGALVVSDGDRIVGIFTERDILNRVVAKEAVPHETIVGDVMTSPMVICRRNTRLAEIRVTMTTKRIRHLPVVEDGKLYGLVSAGDVLASEVAEQQATIEYLHDYLYGRT
ncbi:MAG: CBS domain-containing protein [Planctomycetes bacterium]|nr:CBS domain-containing protein [Planctomycetota bacterium]